jgi:predicted transcriptional regulator
METNFIRFAPDQKIATIKSQITSSLQNIFPVVDETNNLLGMVSSEALHSTSDDEVIQQLCSDSGNLLLPLFNLYEL